MAAKSVATQNQAEIEKLQTTRERDRARYEADRARLQSQLDQVLSLERAGHIWYFAQMGKLTLFCKLFPFLAFL